MAIREASAQAVQNTFPTEIAPARFASQTMRRWGLYLLSAQALGCQIT
jgi:hypothetical protein